MRVWVFTVQDSLKSLFAPSIHPKKAKLAVDFFLPESTKREISSPLAVNRGNKTALQDGASCYVTLD